MVATAPPSLGCVVLVLSLKLPCEPSFHAVVYEAIKFFMKRGTL